MKKFIFVSLALVVALSIIVYPVSAATTLNNRIFYTVDDLVTRYTRYQNFWEVTLGSVDNPLITPFYTFTSYTNGQTQSSYVEVQSSRIPSTGVNNYGYPFTYHINFYPFGASDDNFASGVDLSSAVSDITVFYRIDRTTTTNANNTFENLNITVAFRWFSSTGVDLGTTRSRTYEFAGFGIDESLTFAIPRPNNSNAVYAVIFFEIGGTYANGFKPAYSSSEVWTVGGAVRFIDRSFAPQEFIDQPLNPVVPDNSVDMDDVLDKEDQLFDDLHGFDSIFDNAIGDGQSVFTDFATPILAASFILNMYLEVSFWSDLLKVSLILGLFVVLFGLALSIPTFVNSSNRSLPRGSSSKRIDTGKSIAKR